MNIAIQGHPTRGEEIIQILKSLGATSYNIYDKCSHPEWYWYINKNKEITCDPKKSIQGYKLYTLEEFKKRFPFKIGDRIISLTTGLIGTITTFSEIGIYHFTYDNGICSFALAKYLKLYKEMEKERNITLTLDKAKEWYNKGGELKEVALQAYSEEELTKVELPKSWKEFCAIYPIQEGEAIIDEVSSQISTYKGTVARSLVGDKNVCPSEKSAEAHLAMIQLEQLRDYYRGLFVTVIGMPVWCIVRYKGRLIISQRTWGTNETFLSFQSPEIAEKYLNNFEPLIKQAEGLI